MSTKNNTATPASPSQPSSVAMTDKIREPVTAEDFGLSGEAAEKAEHYASFRLSQSSPKGASTGTEPSELLDLAWWHGAQACNLPAGAPLPKKMHARTAEILREFHRASLSSPQEASKPQDEPDYHIGVSVEPNGTYVQVWDGETKLYEQFHEMAEASGREETVSRMLSLLDKIAKGEGQQGRCANADMLAHDIRALAALTGAAPADANADWKRKKKVIEDAIIGLRDGWAIRSQAEEALEALATIFPTAPEPSAPADKVDAENYRYLRTKVCIIGLESGAYFDFINMPRPTYVAPDAAVELDATIARMRSESVQGGKL